MLATSGTVGTTVDVQYLGFDAAMIMQSCFVMFCHYFSYGMADEIMFLPSPGIDWYLLST